MHWGNVILGIYAAIVLPEFHSDALPWCTSLKPFSLTNERPWKCQTFFTQHNDFSYSRYKLIFSLLCSLSSSFPVQYQMEMMRSLRHVNIDHLHVGWYQSTYYGSFVSRALLDSQFSYQHAIEESVVLIYGESR